MGLKRWWRIIKNRKKLRYLLTYLSDPKVSLFKKLWVIAPLIYLLFPSDLIPDFLLGPGFIDDTLIILLMLGKVWKDLEKYISKYSTSPKQNQTSKVIEFRRDKP